MALLNLKYLDPLVRRLMILQVQPQLKTLMMEQLDLVPPPNLFQKLHPQFYHPEQARAI
jgi:hypothetical protein